MKVRLLPIINRSSRVVILAIAASALIVPFVALQQKVSAAACTPPGTDYGTATTSINLPAAATYRVWTRINVPDSTNNTYLLEIDGNKCYTVGGGSIQANNWVWISHQNGSTSSKIDVALAQGARSVKLIGNKPNVKIDRLVFASDLSCVPTGNGDNCNTPSDTTAPTVRITSPTANASVSGNANLAVTATDATGVSKVEFFVNSTLLGTDTSSPYAFQWDSTKTPNGAQLLTAKAWDAAGNVGIDSFKVTVENGDKQPPTTPTGLTAKATAYNAVTVTWKASTDNSGIAGYTVTRDGLPIANLGNVTTFSESSLSADTTYTYKVQATDTNGNKSALSAAVSVKTPMPSVADTTAPTAPTLLTATTASATQINLTWTVSTDNIGVAKYDIYRSVGQGEGKIVGTSATPNFGDTNLSPNTTYTYFVVAKDAAGNESEDSQEASAKTTGQAHTKKQTIRGVIRDQRSNERLHRASVTYSVNGTRHISQANSRGRYALQRLEPDHYNLTFRDPKHYTKTLSATLTDTTLVKNVTLQKR